MRMYLYLKRLGVMCFGLALLASCSSSEEIGLASREEGSDFAPIKLDIDLSAEQLLPQEPAKVLGTEQMRSIDYKFVETDELNFKPQMDFASGKNNSFTSLGVFYAPRAEAGKRVFVAELKWERKDSDDGKVHYVCRTSVETLAQSEGITTEDLTGKNWYLANVLGGKLDRTTKKITIDPYADGESAGWGRRSKSGFWKLNAPMTSSWIPVSIKKITGHEGLMVNSDERSVFRSRGVLLRAHFKNLSARHLKVNGVRLISNYLDGAASFSFDEASLASAEVNGSQSLELNGETSTTGKYPYLSISAGSSGTNQLYPDARGNENGYYIYPLLFWGMPKTDATGEQKITVELDTEVTISLTSTGAATSTIFYQSHDKRADYYPLSRRWPMTPPNAFFTKSFDASAPIIKDGETGYVVVRTEVKDLPISNLERFTHEMLSLTDNLFMSHHPYNNYRINNQKFWLDGGRYYSFAQQDNFVKTFKPKSYPEDPYFILKGYAQETATSNTKYRLPSADELKSIFPIEGATGTFTVPPAGVDLDLTSDVVESGYNLKNGRASNAKQKAKFRFRGGDVSTVENIKPYTFSGNPLENIRPEHHILNFNPTTGLCYAVALLDENDPMSLVAYRYAWCYSPETGYSPIDLLDIRVDRSVSYHSWSGLRPYTSYMMVSVVPIAKRGESLGLEQIDRIANEDFWVRYAKEEKLVTRLFMASGYSPNTVQDGATIISAPLASVDAVSYIATSTYDGDRNTGSYYYAVDAKGWHLLKLADSDAPFDGREMLNAPVSWTDYDTGEQKVRVEDRRGRKLKKGSSIPFRPFVQ